MNGVFAEPLRPAYSRVVLFRGQSGFTVEDVLAFSWFLGELKAPWRELLEALACQERAGELELETDEEALNSMSEEFRYERELLTVEEIEGWLAARDLTEEDFNDHVVRNYWKKNPPEAEESDEEDEDEKERGEDEEEDYICASPELRELLRVDLYFSGTFDRLARAASWRLVLPEEGETNTELLESEREKFFERTGLEQASLPQALKELGRDQKWLEECLRKEVLYRQVCDTLLTDEARARTLTAQRLLLTRLKIEMLTLRSKDAAQEAMLCLKEKLLSKDELAKECRTSWEPQEFFLGDCEPSVQQEFLSAAPGEVLAPKPYEESFVLSRIEAKIEPKLDDAQIRARIDRRLLRAHFSELTSKSIHWVLGDSMPR